MILSELFALSLVLIGATAMQKSKISNDPPGPARETRFISFNSDGGKIDIDLDLSIPFLSIPLDNEMDSEGHQGPLLNINTKAITVAGLMAAVTAFIVPLFFKTPPGHNYRLNDDFGLSQISNAMNELVLGNNYITPCVQRAACTLVARTSAKGYPTSTDKIIDGITSHRWFKEMTNGTSIQEAISTGRERGHDCAYIYNRCSLPGKIFDNLLNQIGNS